jgi:putative transposase
MSQYRRVFQEGTYYFITIVTHNRKQILINEIDLLRESFKYSKTKYEYEIFAVVILPDHLHMLIKPRDFLQYPDIIKTIKTHFTKNLPESYKRESQKEVSQSKLNKGEKGIWQRRYFEHTIRDEKDLERHLDYIHYNPVKHSFVNSASEWNFSSFKDFVKSGVYENDWGVSEPKQISNFDYE